MGVAVVRGTELLDYGVHQLRNGDRADDLLAHGKEVLFTIIRDHCPVVVAIETPYLIASKRGAVLTTLAEMLRQRSTEFGIAVQELSPEEVRTRVTGNPRARKIEVAATLAHQFRELGRMVPRQPRAPALWLTSRERYWLHMFDALAIAMASSAIQGRLPESS